MKFLKVMAVSSSLVISLVATAGDIEKFYIIFDNCKFSVDSKEFDGNTLGLSCATLGKRVACEYIDTKTAKTLGVDKFLVTYEDRSIMSWESISENTTIYIDHKKDVAVLSSKFKTIVDDSIINLSKSCSGVFMDEGKFMTLRAKVNRRL